MAVMRSPSKNMCSVRHRPMPSAPNSRARLASAGVSALVRTLSVRYLSAHFMTVAKVAGQLGLLRGDLADHHFAGRAVDRDDVLVREGLAADRDLAGLLVDLDLAGAGDAAAAPAAGDDRRVAGHAAGAGEDARGRVHAGDVFGVGFLADQDASSRRRASARPLRRR